MSDESEAADYGLLGQLGHAVSQGASPEFQRLIGAQTVELTVERMEGGFLLTMPGGGKIIASSPAKLAAAVKTWAEQT
jgi:hypothetical protein